VEHPIEDVPVPSPSDTATPTLHLTPRSIVRAVVIAGALLAAFAIAARATETLWWFAQAVVLAALAYPMVQRLSRHMPAFVAVLLLTAITAGLFAGLVAVGLDELRGESQRFRDAVPGAVDRLERSEGLGTVIEDLRLDDSLRSIADQAVRRAQFSGPDLPGLATAVGGRVSAVFVVWILTVMLIFTGPSMIRSLVDQTPARTRDQVDLVLREAYGRTIHYLALTGVRSLVLAVATFSAATLLGLDMPGLLALMAALAAFVPYVGILIGGLPVAFMALLYSPAEALAVLAAVVALQVLDAVVVQRAIDGRSVQLGLFPTLVAAMIGYRLHGPGGLLAGVAIAAMLVAVVNDTGSVRALRDVAHGAEGTADPSADASTDPSPATS
jgi:predicted PurR-regulated permease PerM